MKSLEIENRIVGEKRLWQRYKSADNVGLEKCTSLVEYACVVALDYVQSWYHAKK